MQPECRLKHHYNRRGGAGLDVIQGLRQKDEVVLQLLMQQYGDYLMRTAFLLLKDRHEAEEAVQDSFIQAYYNIRQLREEQKLKSWLTRIVVNRCRMKQRTWTWRRLLPFARMGEFMEEEHMPGPEEQVLMQWRNERLSVAVHKLSYIYREVITLYYFNEMNVREIAGHLQMSDNTVKARLSRGRHLLKELLGEEGVPSGSGTRDY